MLETQLAACLDALPEGDDDAALYGHRLAVFHEDMHAEAFAWMRAAPVTAGRYLRFVEAGGYDDARWWPGPAAHWRASS